MRKNDILSRFQSNNNKLESVLENKDFPVDVKNLLLSMQYNISSSYNDYSRIKVNVEDKNKFTQNIIDIVAKCDSIEIVKPNTEEGTEYIRKRITSEVNTYLKQIKVFPTERAMLFALFKLNDTKMFLDEKYNAIRIALPELLNEGRDINNIEIIRDFNAWSWNTIPSEISNIDCNLIYQNLLILLGFNFLDSWMRLEGQKEVIKKLEEKLKEQYNNDEIDILLDLLYRISIIICIKRNEKEKQRLLDEKEWDEKELARLEDKKKLVIDLTKTKKDKAKEIEKIDKILNNHELLVEEFEKRNKELAEYKKIFNLESLSVTLKKERKKLLNEIDECNKLLDVKIYLERKDELERTVDLLKEISNSRNKDRYKIELQKVFLKCLEERINKIEKEEQKKEIIQLFSILRYYNFIVYDENNFVKDVEALSDQIENLEEIIIKKLYDFKLINAITKDLDTDIRIIKPIFTSRIMNIENIYIQAINRDKRIEINIYDGDIQELGFEIENKNELKVRGKKIRLFNK